MPYGPCGAVQLRHMLEQPCHGHPECGATGRADTRSACGACAASSMRSSVESPIKTPIGLSTFLGRIASCALRQLIKSWAAEPIPQCFPQP